MEKRRMVAKRVLIWEIENGRFFHGDAENMKPNYVITPFGERVSRVNVFGVVTFKFESGTGNYLSFVLDDGTGAIRVKCFGDAVEEFREIEEGDAVIAIGKLKEYEGEVYVNAEVLRKMDPNYEILRKLEMIMKIREKRRMVEEVKEMIEKMSEEELLEFARTKYGLDSEQLQVIRESLNLGMETDYKGKILDIIEQLDKGDGVEVGKIFEVANLPESVIESVIDELLSSGVLYEPLPGKFKKVV